MSERQFFSPEIDYGDRRSKNTWVDPLSRVPSGRGLVLDLGCGGSATKDALEAKGYTWIGLDIDRHPGVTALGDAHRLPFAPETFAAVYSAQLFEHLPDPWGAVHEVFRVLRPGGVFCGSLSCLEPFHDSFFNYTHWGLEALLRQAGSSACASPGICCLSRRSRRSEPCDLGRVARSSSWLLRF